MTLGWVSGCDVTVALPFSWIWERFRTVPALIRPNRALPLECPWSACRTIPKGKSRPQRTRFWHCKTLWESDQVGPVEGGLCWTWWLCARMWICLPDAWRWRASPVQSTRTGKTRHRGCQAPSSFFAVAGGSVECGVFRWLWATKTNQHFQTFPFDSQLFWEPPAPYLRSPVSISQQTNMLYINNFIFWFFIWVK